MEAIQTGEPSILQKRLEILGNLPEFKGLSINEKFRLAKNFRSSSLQNPTPELLRALELVGIIGLSNDSGVRVDDRSVMGLAAWGRGVNLIGDSAASMGIKRYKKLDQSRTEIPDTLIKNPNPWQTQYQWIKYMSTMRVSRGNAYSVIFRDAFYKPIMTVPLHPKYVKPTMYQGQLYYRIECEGFPKVVAFMDMIHWKGLCYNNLIEGISPIEYYAQTLGINLSAEKGQARSNKTGAKKVAITGESGQAVPTNVAESLKRDLDDAYNDKTMGIYVPSGVKLDWLTMTPVEQEFLSQRQYGAIEVARILNIPARLLDAIEGRATSTTVEQESLNFYVMTMHPMTADFEQELNFKLLLNEDEYFKFNFNSLMRADAKTRLEAYTLMKRLGWTDNEIRALEDTDRYEGGDMRYATLQDIPKEYEAEYWPAKIESFLKGNNNNPGGNNNDIQN